MSMTRSSRLDFRRRRPHDLGKRLEQQEAQKNISVSGSSMPTTILVEDDDDDVHISSPRSFAQATSAVNSSRQRNRSVSGSRTSVVENRTSTEDLLELRLGPTSYTQSGSVRIRGAVRHSDPSTQSDGHGTFMIDLTRPSPSYDADCILVNEFVQKKRKPTQVANEPLHPEPAKEFKLTCAICMESMKEETSTVCGHIFCRGCILEAISAQKKCPTCRQKLTTRHTHRIYISGSLRNP